MRRALVALIVVALLPVCAAGAVTITLRPTEPPVPAGFVGLSFEASALPAIARDGRQGNLVRLLRSLGPGVVRFGGASVDTAPSRITSGDFRGLRTLLDRSRWRAIIALPLGPFDPRAAAGEAASAQRALGPRLMAVEFGNEPNAYWLSGLRTGGWDLARYLHQVAAYRRAVERAAPGLAIAGPDTTLPLPFARPSPFDGFHWLDAFARVIRPALLTPHLYPLDVCRPPAPPLAALTSRRVNAEEARMLAGVARIGAAAGIPVRLGETNNIGCSGEPGVSDTLASALWALRLELLGARAGLSGLNLHTLPDSCSGYSPLCAPTPADAAAGRLQANPEWYALRLFAPLIGERRLPVAGAPAGVTVAAFGTAGHLELLVLNPGAETVRVTARVFGRYRVASVCRLTAPSLAATTGVRFTCARAGSLEVAPGAALIRLTPVRGSGTAPR